MTPTYISCAQVMETGVLLACQDTKQQMPEGGRWVFAGVVMTGEARTGITPYPLIWDADDPSKMPIYFCTVDPETGHSKKKASMKSFLSFTSRNMTNEQTYAMCTGEEMEALKKALVMGLEAVDEQPTPETTKPAPTVTKAPVKAPAKATAAKAVAPKDTAKEKCVLKLSAKLAERAATLKDAEHQASILKQELDTLKAKQSARVPPPTPTPDFGEFKASLMEVVKSAVGALASDKANASPVAVSESDKSDALTNEVHKCMLMMMICN